MADSPAGWFPVLTTIIGFATGSINEWLRDRRTSKRDSEARDALRRAQLAERRANFQRETLIDLQDAVTKFTRITGKMHHIERMELKKTGKWGGFLFPEGLSDSALEANVKIMVLNSRVRDEHIRELAERFRGHANKIGILPSPQATEDASLKMIETIDPLHKRIGEILRKLDDDEDAAH